MISIGRGKLLTNHKSRYSMFLFIFLSQYCASKYLVQHCPTADHGRSDWLGYWVEFVQKARFKKLACLCHIKQNDLTYLGQVCTPCLSVSTGIYGPTYSPLATCGECPFECGEWICFESFHKSYVLNIKMF